MHSENPDRAALNATQSSAPGNIPPQTAQEKAGESPDARRRQSAEIVALRHPNMHKQPKRHLAAVKRPRVVVTERQLLHYRVACYERMREILDAAGVELQLLVGEGTPEEKMKKDRAIIPWAIDIPTHYFLGDQICWQPYGQYARGADLVILNHENKLVYNLWLLSLGRPKRVAFWGHGRNMQSMNPDGFKERFKRWTVNKVDWWFAYTEESADLVAKAGFPRECTTVVENAIDTRELIALCERARRGGKAALREKLGLGNGPVGLYLGSLYREKRIDFLLDAALAIRQSVPDFQLLVVGAGPQEDTVRAAASAHPWIKYLGPLQGFEKAQALVAADITLNPGLVGLSVLDSFVGASPMFTTDCGIHSPEIAYLSSGRNGMITPNRLDAYVDAVTETLNDPQRLEAMQKEAYAMASRYTIENMAARICDGILACLER
jgi:glycosyltransferase involved in cell wall biosynthesis